MQKEVGSEKSLGLTPMQALKARRGPQTQESLTMSKSGDSVGPSQFVKAMALVGFVTTLYGAGCHFLKK